MNDCPKIRQILAEQAMGNPPMDVDALSLHLESCADCRGYQEGLMAQDAALTRLSQDLERDLAQRQQRAQEAFRHYASHTPQRSGPPTLNGWPRWAVAAGILLLAGLILSQWGSFSLTGRSFARMAQAVNQAPWLHIIMKGDHRDEDQLRKVWAGFDTGVLAVKKVGGFIEYVDLTPGKEYQYDPQTRSLKIVPVRLDKFVYDLASPQAFLQSILRSYAVEGAELSETNGFYDGQAVRIFTAIHDYPHGQCTLEVFVDPETHLPRAGRETWQGPHRDPQITEIELQYPDTGPTSIYDLGVPAMADIQDQTRKPKTSLFKQ